MTRITRNIDNSDHDGVYLPIAENQERSIWKPDYPEFSFHCTATNHLTTVTISESTRNLYHIATDPVAA